MKLLSADEIKALPDLYDNEHLKADQVKVPVKFFDPCGSWTWYLTEVRSDGLCFGLVDGLEKELGYFTLKELGGHKGPLGIGIERDFAWDPQTTLAQVMKGDRS